MAYNTSVYKSGSQVYAQRYDGTVIYGPPQGNNDTAAIQAALDVANTGYRTGGAGIVHIHKANYSITGGMSVRSNTRVIMDPLARLQVAQGYAGSVWYITNSVFHAWIEGGIIEETGTPQQLWHALLIHTPSAGGTAWITVRNMTVFRPNTAVRLDVADPESWINGIIVENLTIYFPVVGIDFVMTPAWQEYHNGFNRNIFRDIRCHSDSITTHGIRNIRNKSQVFINVEILGSPMVSSATVHADSEDTVIISGAMTHSAFSDNGLYTTVMDPYKKVRFGKYENVIAGIAPLSTAATNGFWYLPTMPGPPTGAPPVQAWAAPVVYDTVNKRLYVRDIVTGTWKYAALT